MRVDFKGCFSAISKLQALNAHKNVAHVEDMFVFAHFTTSTALEDIKTGGLKGRVLDAEVFNQSMLTEVSKLTDKGYIFAYRVEGSTPEEAQELMHKKLETYLETMENPDDRPYVIMFNSVVYGYAYAGLEIFKDDEQQMLIPVDCIDTENLLFAEDLDAIFPRVW